MATLSDTTISSRKGDGSTPSRRAHESTTLHSNFSTLPEVNTYLAEHPSRASARTLDRRHHTVLDFLDVHTTPLTNISYTPSSDTPLPNRRETDTGQPPAEEEAIADERVMVLPWPLGERLLALLTNRPAQHPQDGSVSGSEPLPPYEEQDARA
ncbi:uncharacterized protein TRAVEDRAFT_74237 [Trametes versicolor FP-101664 SS1]|uniref:uncharacterized protein n=1 Tax=Trametes versicolor (strain FP-101664) TaxID=717944 RepID=UPI0004622E90|nr:uncharacterized protein TRAVEDRAFT_74237 [Trametes versicolor FP-101664 SS1]EIW53841.1 hypothetical protein TRAVEDRAFT_74237 [Trametes versicolor FP-101664 SS1]